MENVEIQENLDYNIAMIRGIFLNCQDVVQKKFIIQRENVYGEIYVVYIDGLTDNEMVEESVLKPVCYGDYIAGEENFFDAIYYREAMTVDIAEEESFEKTLDAILKGDTAIFVDGYCKTLIVSTKKFPLRGISENDTEVGVRGPKDSFNEGFRQSTALIRRRIRDPKLKVWQGHMGSRSKTDYAIMYLEDVADKKLVKKIRDSIERYEIDAIFDSGMAQHIMEEDWRSPFPKFQSTTRPDKVASGIVEGRVAVVFDNSPEVILAPTNINILLQGADDYYNSYFVGSFARILRYIAAFIAVALPGLYIAITVYHSEMLPSKLLYAIAQARSLVTFPVIVEILIMEFFFELLREAGIRLPGPLGNTIGIVGGLIVGQAAVEAGIVSTIVVIIVALTAIASFSIPNEEFGSVFRLLKFFIIITSSALGLYGFLLGFLIIGSHLCGLCSFGIPYTMPSKKDYILRWPIKSMRNRPIWAQDKIRLKKRS